MSTTAAVRTRRTQHALVQWVAAHKALVGLCALVGAYYLWTVWSSGSPVDFGSHSDPYNLLTDGLLHGHLRLLVEPKQALLDLANPYDPTTNDPYAIHDLSLYKDHYYLYWGPTPALLLFGPARIFGATLPQTLAIFLFAWVGFCFSVASLRLLVRRYAPETPRWMLGVGLLALAYGNALPYTLRRADVYEVAISAGFCLTFIALYLVLTQLDRGFRPRRMIAASLLLGLAVGARPPMIVPTIAFAVLCVWLARRTTDREQRRTIVATMIGPVLAIGILLALYNALRFGSPFEFGQKYQLAAYDPTVRSGDKVRYIAPGAWYYLFARPHLTLGFPFVHLQQPPHNYPFHTPSDYDSVEPVSGLFPSVPFVLLAFATPFALRGTARRVNYSLLGIAAAILVVVSFAVWGATMRYEVDFTSYVLVAAGLAWVAAVARTSGVWRRVIAGVGVALTVWSVLFGLATGMSGYLETLRRHETGTYRRLQVLTSPLPTAISLLSGRPKAVDVWAPTDLEANSGGDAIGHLTFSVGRRALELDVVSGSKRRWGLAMTGQALEPPPKGTHVTIANPATGQVVRLRPEFAPTVVPIALKRGLNRISITAGGAAHAQARLADVHLTEPPPG